MDEIRPANALAGSIGSDLSRDICHDFIKLRQDCTTSTLERASPGKFVESFVQCMQYLATGNFEAKPDVDSFLSRKIETFPNLPEGLRICGARAARTIYSLRNKRNIAHKNSIDPNSTDLKLAYDCARWIMSELLRSASNLSMDEAAILISRVRAPLGTLVEEIDGVRLVHAELSTKGEILVLLHSHYPERALASSIIESLRSRSAGSVRNRIAEMRVAKLLHGDAKTGYRLTQAGYHAALYEIDSVLTKRVA